MISQHFNTNKHKRICLLPENKLFKEDYGFSNSLNDAFDKKCKENRNLKKLNYEYKDELDKLKKKYDELEKINILLQKKSLDIKPKNIRIANLIDL
jgi:predicted nuclease with TOPRIM domain